MVRAAFDKQMSSNFLDKLPPEIRNSIYRQVLVAGEGPVSITKNDYLARKALVDTCKQVRDEAKDITIAENTLHVVCGKGDGWVAARWQDSMGKALRTVKKLVIAFELSEDTKYNTRLL